MILSCRLLWLALLTAAWSFKSDAKTFTANSPPLPAIMPLTSQSLLTKSRLATHTYLKNPSSIRHFHPTNTNMVVRCFFECTWHGPEVEIDSKGNVTKVGAEKGRLPLTSNPFQTPSRLLLHFIEEPLSYSSSPLFQFSQAIADVRLLYRPARSHQLRALRRRRPQDS